MTPKKQNINKKMTLFLISVEKGNVTFFAETIHMNIPSYL